MKDLKISSPKYTRYPVEVPDEVISALKVYSRKWLASALGISHSTTLSKYLRLKKMPRDKLILAQKIIAEEARLI